MYSPLSCKTELSDVFSVRKFKTLAELCEGFVTTSYVHLYLP